MKNVHGRKNLLFFFLLTEDGEQKILADWFIPSNRVYRQTDSLKGLRVLWTNIDFLAGMCQRFQNGEGKETLLQEVYKVYKVITNKQNWYLFYVIYLLTVHCSTFVPLTYNLESTRERL